MGGTNVKMMKSLIAASLAAMFATTGQSAENLTGETASPGGSIHLSMAHLAEAAAAAGVANIQVADGQTLTNSVQNVAEGKTDIAGTPYILPFLLAKGRGPYSKLGAEKGAELAANLRALYPVTLGIFALYAYDSKGLKGWGDLEGKTIYNGPPRGAAVKDKWDSDPFQKYLRAPGSAPFTLPVADANLGKGVTLKSADGIFRGLATIGGDIVNKNMSFDLAKALTKAHIDTLDQLKAKAPFAKHAGYGVVDVVKSGMCGPNPLKYHAGAVAAWEEAGYKIDDCAKP